MHKLSLLLVVGLLGACADDPETMEPTDAGGVDGGIGDAGPAVTDAGVDAAPDPDAGPPECGPDERVAPLVYFGTATPTAMPLTAGQILAVVDFEGCSGAFVTDEWVLTADHCGITVGRRLCVGMDAASPDVCFTADRVEDNPAADMSLVHVDAPASTRIPELEPIPIMTERIDATWIGRTAEAAGYGTQEDTSSGEREFTAEPIEDVGVPYVTVDGMGTRGLCFGDSGGPLMVLASDSTVRVLGTLSGGDASCVGLDNFTRTDLHTTWIEAIIGPIAAAGAPCGPITVEGRCMGASSAIWCDGAVLASETCAAGEACGWSAADTAYRCVMSDPCEGVGAAGECQAGTAVWCDAGTLRRRGCEACGQICRYVSDMTAFYCAPDPCVGIDPAGECDGTVIRRCDADGIRMFDCASRGRTCGWDESRGRNRCIR